VRRRDADVEAAFRHEVDGVGRVVVVEDDLASPVGAPAGERQHRTDVRAGDSLEEPPLHLCSKRYTPCVAAVHDAERPAS